MIESRDPRGYKYYWVGILEKCNLFNEGTDLWAVENNHIAVSPLRVNLSEHGTIAALRDKMQKPTASMPERKTA
jgi:5'-nucleotidase